MPVSFFVSDFIRGGRSVDLLMVDQLTCWIVDCECLQIKKVMVKVKER